MFRIAVCDDDRGFCACTEELLRRYAAEEGRPIRTELFFDGEELTGSLARGSSFDLILLDIEMKKLSGIRAGEIIRRERNDHLTQIIYISSRSCYGPELFDFHPLDFLEKPVDRKRLLSKVALAMEISSGLTAAAYGFEENSRVRRIPYKDIRYFESEGRKIRIHVRNGETVSHYGKLGDVEPQLPGRYFLRIHQSYIVNYYYVFSFGSEGAVLEPDRRSLPVARRYRGEAKKRFLELIRQSGV